jgi:hypothetical protein
MKNKYIVISTKAGFAVQNTTTYTVLGVYSKDKAEEVCNNLNTPKKIQNELKTYIIKGNHNEIS